MKENVWWLRVATSSQHHAQHSPYSAGLMSWCELQPASARQRQRWWKWEPTQRIKGTKQLKGKPGWCFCAVQSPPLLVIYSLKGCQGRVRGEDGISRSPSCTSLLSHSVPCCCVNVCVNESSRAPWAALCRELRNGWKELMAANAASASSQLCSPLLSSQVVTSVQGSGWAADGRISLLHRLGANTSVL